MKDNKIAIFIDSYDGYSDLWNDFFKIFHIFWSDCKFTRYLVSNEREYDDNNLICITTGKELNWFYRTRKALESVKEEYIVFMLEDYFISKNIDNKDIEDIVKTMEQNSIYFYKLTGTENADHGKNMRVLETAPYPINLQLAIWNKHKFIELLDEMQRQGATTPWDFEVYFVHKYQSGDEAVYIDGVLYDTRDLFGYKNGVLKGKWIRETIAFYKKLGLDLHLNERAVMTVKETMYYKTKVFLATKSSRKGKKFLKQILKMIGFKFMS